MHFGVHLPLIDFDGNGWSRDSLFAVVDAARDLGFTSVSANDHLVFQKPWLDGIVALAAIIERSGEMQLATTVSLPVVRGPATLAKAATAIDILSGGRLVLGVGPGSSARDYETAGIDFDERWPRLDEAIRVLRHQLQDGPAVKGKFYSTPHEVLPRPSRAGGPPIWIGSWGSDAGLRRVARLGDGWLASAYNTTPVAFAEGKAKLATALEKQGKDPRGFPCALATMWTFVTEDAAEASRHLDDLARMLNRPAEALAAQVLVGPAEQCAEKLRRYKDAGAGQVFLWPLAEVPSQLERCREKVLPLLETPGI